MRAQGTLPLTAAKRRSIRKTGVYRYPRIQTCALDNFTFAPPKKVEGRVAEVEKSEDDSPMWESFGCSPVLNFASKAEDAEQKKEEKKKKKKAEDDSPKWERDGCSPHQKKKNKDEDSE